MRMPRPRMEMTYKSLMMFLRTVKKVAEAAFEEVKAALAVEAQRINELIALKEEDRKRRTQEAESPASAAPPSAGPLAMISTPWSKPVAPPRRPR